MTAQELRKSILQSAVQGKLVPQLASDEPASVLFSRIQKEKTELIKQGKIKKEKPLPPITDEEKPFELPEGWVWCRIGSLFSLQAGKFIEAQYIQENKTSSLYPCYGGNGLRGYVEQYNRCGDYPLIGRQGALCGNIKRAIGEFYATEHAVVVESFKNLDIALICYFLTSLNLNQYATSTAQPGLSVLNINKVLFPLPPLEEQKRIVSKVDELMLLCDELEKAEQADKALDKHFFDTLPKSILQSAVQGKLVPQNPNDEHANELFKRIQKEKAELIKQGKIKKEKALPPITDEEKPFDLPEGWVWCRLGEVVEINPRNKLDDSTPVSFLPMTLISQDFFGGHGHENRLWQNVKSGFTHFADNDVLLAKITPCFQNRKSCIARELQSGYGAGTTELHVLRSFNIIPEYLLIFLKTPDFIKQGVDNMTGTAGQQRVPTDYLKNALFPLPPLEEQKRIVKKVEELMGLCGELGK